jgi:low temperature requirement protein LtrA
VDSGGTFRLDPPRLRTTEDASLERHTTWFELYFDLVFVAAVSELGTGLAREPTAAVFARFAGLFVVVVWAWIGFTMYANRFDTDDLPYRLSKAAAAFAIASLAVQIPHVISGHGGTAGIAASYSVARLLLLGLYVRARRHVAGLGRGLIDVYLTRFSISTVLWIASIAVPAPYRQILWAVGIAIDLSAPPSAWRRLPGATVVISHATDRFGTFFIIVLGESVISVVGGVAGLEFSLAAWAVAGLCFVTALTIWWIYFDLADTSVLGRGALGVVYLYAHFPIFGGVAAFGVGTKLAITQANQAAIEAGGRWALGGGIAAFAVGIAALHLGAEWTSKRDPAFIGRLVLAAGSTLLAAVGSGLAPVAFVAILATATVVQLLVEAFTFRVGAATPYVPPALATSAGLAAPGTAASAGSTSVS